MLARKRRVSAEREAIVLGHCSSKLHTKILTVLLSLIESASLYSLYDTVDKLRSSIVEDGNESDSTGSGSGNNNKRESLRLAAGDVVKEVEKLVPSGSNSFLEWRKSTDNEN